MHPTYVDIQLLDGRAGGWDVLVLARRVPATRTVPIIVCSADARFLNTKRQALRVFGCFVLAKPFDIEQLLQAVTALLDGQRGVQAVGE